MSSSDVTATVDALYKQAIEQVKQGNDAFTVACALSLDPTDEFEDTRVDWHHKYAFDPHVRAMIFRKLCDYGWTDLYRTLSEDDRAQTIGYEPEKFPDGKDAPDRTTLSRAWNDYFGDDLKQVITETVEHIRDYARETGNLIGSQTLSTEDKDGVSPRTEYRVKRRKAHKTAEQFRDLFYDEIPLEVPDDAQFDKDDLFDFFLHIALTDDFANNGADTWKEEVEDEDTAPSGDTFRSYPRELDELHENEVTELFDAASDVLWQMADRRGYLDGFSDVAVDSHAWRYYGASDTPRVSSVKPDRGTNQAYEFLTLSVIGDKSEKFTLAISQVSSKQEKLETVKDLVEEADKRLFVRDVVLDRGFYKTMFAQALKETGVNFVIRAQRGTKTNKMWDEAEDGVNVERVTMSRSYAPYESVEVTRFVVPARETANYEYITFITNRELTRRQARRISASYERRWGIETSYRVTNDFLPKTTSKDFALRQFYYRFAVLLYNVWVLVNAVVAASIGHPEDASPPVTAKYLLVVARNKHDEKGVG